MRDWFWKKNRIDLVHAHAKTIDTSGRQVLLQDGTPIGGRLLGDLSMGFSQVYGFIIGAVFSGVVGVGFYPIFGSRVWCRFGCPMAAVLGIIQKYFSRFRITANGGQCISCGNCSTYCEMGIDVRAYAQKGQNIIRPPVSGAASVRRSARAAC